jgi:PAS domain S-box-containing protein
MMSPEDAEDGSPSQLAASHALAAEILDRIQDGFYAIDDGWRFVYANRRACAMWGTTREAVVGRVLWECFPEIVGTEAERQLRDAVAAGAASEFETFSPVVRHWLWLRVDPIGPGMTGVYWRDVTARKAAEEALRESEERFRTMLEAQPHIAFVLEPDGTMAYWNRRYVEYIGGPVTDVAGRADFHHPADRPHALAVRADGMARGAAYSFEARLRRHDGEYRWHAMHVRPLRRAAGLFAWLGTAVDIDDVRRANEALERRVAERTAALADANRRLAESEESLRSLFRKAPVPMHALDAEHRILDVNDAWLEALGFAREDVIGRPVLEFQAAGSAQHFAALWARILADGSARDLPRTFVKASGEAMEALVSSMVERDPAGRFVRLISTITDVTARRRAERLAERERRFTELLVMSSTEGIAAVDRDLRYTVWNPSMEAVSGIPRRDILGRSLLEMFQHLAGTAVEEGWRRALEGAGSSLRDWPFRYPQSGREGFFDQTFAPLYDADRSIIGAIAFIHDTTERRRAEEALRQAQKIEAVGQLTGGIAHDFNNLLTVISGNLDLLESHVAGEAGRRLIGAARRGAERAARLTGSLLAFARRQQLRPETVNANRLIQEFRDLLRRAAGEAIDLQLVLNPTLDPCRIDPAQFQSALLNLVINARDAMPAEGGRIAIETQNVEIGDDQSTGDPDLAPGRYAVVTVADTGSGMTDEVRRRAFEPFYTTKEVGKGSGLGLSQVYGFVKQSGGHVQLGSELGVGTSVSLFLPQSGDAAAPDPPAGAGAVPRGSETILVVEDDAEVRATVVRGLEALGYRVLAARDGPEALRLLSRSERVDLLFSDVVMPEGMRGDELARRARALRRGLRVLLTSGYAKPEGAGRLDETLRLLAKPYRQEELARAIRSALDT